MYQKVVGLQPTVIASRASPPLLEQSSSKNRGRASPVKSESYTEGMIRLFIVCTRQIHNSQFDK